jgi:hypothetical protein
MKPAAKARFAFQRKDGLALTTDLIPPEKILNSARDEELSEVVVVGEKDDGEFYFASSEGDLRHTQWLLTRALHEINKMADAAERKR